MPSEQDPADRLRAILERTRAEVAPKLPAELLDEIAHIEDREMFNDDRKPALQRVREAVRAHRLTTTLEASEQ